MRIKHLGPVNHGLEENSRKGLSKSNRHRFEIHGPYAIFNSLTPLGVTYILNISWKHCRLETSFEFGNMDWILKTKIGYWKHEKAFGNITFILETLVLYWKLRIVYWKHKKCILG